MIENMLARNDWYVVGTPGKGSSETAEVVLCDYVNDSHPIFRLTPRHSVALTEPTPVLFFPTRDLARHSGLRRAKECDKAGSYAFKVEKVERARDIVLDGAWLKDQKNWPKVGSEWWMRGSLGDRTSSEDGLWVVVSTECVASAPAETGGVLLRAKHPPAHHASPTFKAFPLISFTKFFREKTAQGTA